MPHAKALFEEAHRLIGGDRRDAYGSYNDEAKRIAALWSALLGHEVPPRMVPIMMMALKLNRMRAKKHADSVVDVCGYAGLLAEMEASL